MMATRNRYVFAALLVLACGLLCGAPSRALAATLRGADGLKVYLQKDSDLGGAAYLAYITGVKSVWADKPFRVERTEVSGGERYSFPYDVALSSGVQVRSYVVLTEGDGVLYKGSYVKGYDLYLPEHGANPLHLRLDTDGTDDAAKVFDGVTAGTLFKPNPDGDGH